MAEHAGYTPRYANSWALIIGIDRYDHASPLQYAANDARAVAQVLETHFGFPKQNITLLLDGEATAKNIVDAFAKYGKDGATGPDDRLIFFFAGHGHTKTGHRREVGFLVPSDGDPERHERLIRWDELTRNADFIEAKHILFLMDACYGGLALHRSGISKSKRFVEDMLQRRARQVLTAGKADQQVSDGDGARPGHSIFTAHLLAALEGAAATDDGLLTATNVMSYVYDRVAGDEYSDQTPHYGSIDGDGDLIFKTTSDADATLPLPPPLPLPLPLPTPLPTRRHRRRQLLLFLSLLLLLFAVLAVTADFVRWSRQPLEGGDPFSHEAKDRLEVIEKHVSALERMKQHEAEGTFYGPLDLQRVQREYHRWQGIASALRQRIKDCEQSEEVFSSACDVTLVAGIPVPKPAPVAGRVVVFARTDTSQREDVIDIRRSAPFRILFGDEGHTGPLAIGVKGERSADGSAHACGTIAPYVEFTSGRTSFRLDESLLPRNPFRALYRGPVVHHVNDIFVRMDWPPADAFEVALHPGAAAGREHHAPCAEDWPTVMIWQPDARFHPPGSPEEMALRAAAAADAVPGRRYGERALR